MGSLRSWTIRGTILTVLAAIGAAGWVAHDWMSPERVRAATVAALQEQFPGSEVEVESAQLRIFGGVSVSGVRVTRKGESQPFLEIPSATLAHDKEQLNRGKLVIRKIELERPTIRLVRRADGTWNISDAIKKPGSPDDPVPTVVVNQATVFVTDERPDGLPPMALTDARFNLLNDPVTMLKIEAQGNVRPAPGGTLGEGPPSLSIPVVVTAKVNRTTSAVTARIEVVDLAFGPELAPALGKIDPHLADHASFLTARLGIKADVTTQPEKPPKYDLKVDIRDGRYEGPNLPWPAEHLSASVRVQDGRVTVEKGSARFGKAAVEFSLECPGTPILGAGPMAADNPLKPLEDRLERYDITVRDLALDEDFFNRLPAAAGQIRRMFSPNGAVDIGVKFARSPTGWKREIDVRPNRLAISYEKFRYPVTDLAGSLKLVTGSDGTDEFRVQMTGSGGGRRVEIAGRVGNEGVDPLIDLRISGTDIPVDDKIFNALPPRYTAALGKLRSTARGDFVVEIRQPEGVNRCENTFRIRVYDGRVNYTHFPYPLTSVKGNIVVRVVGTDSTRPLKPGMEMLAEPDADLVELRDFEAMHGGGKLWVSGDSRAVPGSKDRKLSLRLLGENCPIDDDLKASLFAMKLSAAWDDYAPRGRITFGADVEIVDRQLPATPLLSPSPDGVVPVAAALPGEAGFYPPTDLRFTFNFRGPSITPKYFAYDLDELTGVVRYQGGKLDLAKFSAKHGPTTVALDAAEVRFGDGGEVWANVGGLSVRPLIADEAFRNALPVRLRKGLESLKLRGPMDLAASHIVIKVPSGFAGPPPPAPIAVAGAVETVATPATSVYWNAVLKFAGASLNTGVDWTDAYGSIASVGLYEGTHLGTVVGNAWFDKATIAKQPVTAAKIAYRIRPQQPDPLHAGAFLPPVLEVPELSGTLYQGTVGGEARVVLDEDSRYRLWLTASGIRIDELAQTHKLGAGAELRGLAQGKLLLENQPDPKTGLLTTVGSGQIDVPNGRMLNLPVMLPLLKLLKLQTPDQTAFEEAHAIFELKGDRITVTQLDLIGTAVSLGGSGELDTAGEDVRFEFYTVWSQALKRWLTTPLGDVTSFLSGNLFKIEMQSKHGEMTYKSVVLPAVTEPFKNVAERLKNRLGQAPPPGRPNGAR